MAMQHFSIRGLKDTFAGEVIEPGDQSYDGARQVFVGGVDRKPAVIIRPVNAQEVSQVIRLAQESGMPLAVKSGGHSSAGHGVIDGGIVLDVHEFTDMAIDVKGKTVWAGSGLTAAQYTKKAGAYGLATGFGDTGSVGIAGITLGGGIGYFVRKFGLTIDDLLGVELVCADGAVLTVDEKNHPDLFWAIRGGGGNFGVVTKFHYRLHDVDTILGGMMVLPATTKTIVALVDFLKDSPEELNVIVNIMTAPPMPFVPKEYYGKPVLMILMAYIGDIALGEKAAQTIRSIAQPIADMVRRMKYPEIYPPEQEAYHPVSAARTMFINEVTEGVADTMLGEISSSKAAMAVAQLRVLGGAMGRVDVTETAFAHRKSKIMVNLAAVYQNIQDRPVHEAWVSGFFRKMEQDDAGAYVNFLGDEGAARVRAAYPGATWDRLRKIKTRYDPTNLFRYNQNIPPEEKQI